MNDADYEIRLARPDEVASLPAIERAAAQLFANNAFGVDLGTLEETASVDDLAAAQRAGMLWVAVAPSGEPVGFACARWLGDQPHLEELDVRPDHARRGLGAKLVRAVIEFARARVAAAVTLSTFRDVPWNGPFYERLGFRALDASELTPPMRDLITAEARKGLPIERRVVMRLALERKKEKGNGPFEDRPPSRSSPPTLRPATRDDVEFLFATLRAAIGPYVESWDDAEQRDLFVGTIDLATHQVIEVDGRAVGCLSVEEFIDRVALNRIFLLPDAQRRGVGTQLIGAVRDRAHARGLPLVLSVQRGNPAQALYERLGFAVVSETSTHFGMEAAPPEPRAQ